MPLLLRLALCLALFAPGARGPLGALARSAAAQTIAWEMPNEYPATSIHGEGDVFFGALVRQKTGGRIVITHRFDGANGLRSKDMLAAVATGKVALADIYGGALGDAEPIFLLPSLPFVAVTTDHARALFETAQAEYDRVLAKHNQKLLYPYLDHFTAINYAMPLSLVTINLAVWNGLPQSLRAAVRDAAASTEARQWTAIRKRVEENYGRMQANRVTLTTTVPPALVTALKAAGREAVEAWVARFGPEGRLLLADYDRRTR
ncbi:MAG: hypothetical protein HY060_04995 [Proteobacteria bacterium]|nr:hypothetical protein [Pseudomonadota bacterium]